VRATAALAVAAALALPAPGGSSGAASICASTLVPSTAGSVRDPALTEVSGLDAGIRSPGVWWLHNDSGDAPRVFAVGRTGRTLGVYRLAGAEAVDWEAIDVGPGPRPGVPYLYLADVGDNGARRAEIRVYRVPEPRAAAGGGTLRGVETLRLAYPDGPRDAEALVVDPRSGALLLIEKREEGGPASVYRAPAGLRPGVLSTLRRSGTLRLGAGLVNAVTAADLSRDGARLAVRTYGSVHLWQRPPGRSVEATLARPSCRGPTPLELQGEAVAFRPDGRAYATIAEGRRPPIHLVTAR
jgi:hypothetical protein